METKITRKEIAKSTQVIIWRHRGNGIVTAGKKAVTVKKTPTPSRTGAITGNLGFMNLLMKKEVKHNTHPKETTWKVGENSERIWAYVRAIAAANAKQKFTMLLCKTSRSSDG